MNHTSRMAELLGRMRRERNGAVADAMRIYGRPYGLNYGVSLPTVRQIARAETPDYDFACYLYLQDVRELRLAALHIAQPERFGPGEFAAWAAGIDNSEVAEEAAFALLGRSAALPALYGQWIVSSNSLLCYAALLAAARSSCSTPEWITLAFDALCRFGGGTRGEIADLSASDSSDAAIAPDHALHLIAQGVVALLVAIGSRNDENRQAVLRAAGSRGELPAADFIHEELAWRLEP